MSATVVSAVPEVSTSSYVALSSEALAEHLAFMDRLFSKAVRAEMAEQRKFLASLPRTAERVLQTEFAA